MQLAKYTLFILLYHVNSPAFCQGSDQAQAQITISTDFEAGNLGKIEQLSKTHWRCGLAGETDWQQRNRQASWYYFRIDGAKNQELTIDLVDLLGEYNYKPGTHAITSQSRPVISYDQKKWEHLSDEQVIWDEKNVELRLQVQPRKNRIWIAHQPPYTTRQLDEMLQSFKANHHLKAESIGKTPEGRDILLLTIAQSTATSTSKKVIWIMARQHAWESGTSWVMESIIHFLLGSEGSRLLNHFTFKIVPMADPDGVARGGIRFNAFGHDLNRNWDLVKVTEMPEIFSQKSAFAQWLSKGNPIDFFLTLHNTESADYLQGPDLPVGEKVWENMTRISSFEAPEGLRPMPEIGDPGRMTVNQNLATEFRIPAYLMELKVENVTKINRRRLVADWIDLGPHLIRSITKALQE
jgi:hypothetical protein